jgi:hypothetical protein
MATKLRIEKYVASLPGTLTANTLYFVRVGAGFDLYVTNDQGIVAAYALNTGSSSPNGATGRVQYNNAGAFGGATNVSITAEGNLGLLETGIPPTPAAGIVSLVRSLAGRRMQGSVGPSGVDVLFQPAFFGNAIFMVSTGNGTTAPSTFGGILSTAATMSTQQSFGNANLWQTMRRQRFQTSTTAGNATGCRTGYTQWWRGNAANQGGFFFRAWFGQNINLNGGQSFVGLCASTGALAGEPSALLNMIGVGYDAADASTGNWFLMRNDGSGVATKIDLGTGAARNTTDGLQLTMFCRPNDTKITVEVMNLSSGNIVLAATDYNTDIPANNAGLSMKAECRNGAVAAAHNIEIARIYIESDY